MSLPPMSALTTQTALTGSQNTICRSLPHSQHYFGKRLKVATKVALQATNQTLVFVLDLVDTKIQWNLAGHERASMRLTFRFFVWILSSEPPYHFHFNFWRVLGQSFLRAGFQEIIEAQNQSEADLHTFNWVPPECYFLRSGCRQYVTSDVSWLRLI